MVNIEISNQDPFDEAGLEDTEEDEEEYSRAQKQIKKKWKKRDEERNKNSAPNSHLDKKKRLNKLQIDAGEGSSRRKSGRFGKGEKRELDRNLFRIGDDEDEVEAPEEEEEEEDVPLQINEENNDAPSTDVSSIRPRFSKEMKEYHDRHCLYLPKDFAASTGIRENTVVKLINTEEREWPVHVIKKGRNGMFLSRGWCHFVCDNKVTFNSILSFVWHPESKLKVHIEMGVNKPMFDYVPISYRWKRREQSTSSRTKRSRLMAASVASSSSYDSESTQYQEESANNTTSLSLTCDESDSEAPTVTSSGETSVLTVGLTLSDPDVLNCPICFNPLTIPVYQCVEGHFSCQSCWDKIKDKCPTCSKPVGNKRCIGMENVLKSINKPCQNMQYGCMKKISYLKKLAHENLCEYAPTSCPHFRCKYVGVVKSFYSHYVEKHPDSCKLITFNSVNSINVVGEEPYLLLEKKEKILFYLTRVIDPFGSFVCVSTASMKFSCDLTAVSGDKSVNMKSMVEVTAKYFTKPAKEKCLFVMRIFHRETNNGVSRLPLELSICKVGL